MPDLSVACEHCGAPASEPCEDTCPLMADIPDWLGTADHLSIESLEDTYALPPIEQSRGNLMAAVYRLPFGRLAGDPPDHRLMSEQQWTAELAEFMQRYMEVAHQQVDHLSAMATKAISLELQRDMSRQWLGVSSSS